MVDDFRGRGGSPWGSPPGGGGNGSGRKGPTPPDIDEIIRNLQDKINRFMPGGAAKGGKPIIFGLIILLVIVWLGLHWLEFHRRKLVLLFLHL